MKLYVRPHIAKLFNHMPIKNALIFKYDDEIVTYTVKAGSGEDTWEEVELFSAETQRSLDIELQKLVSSGILLDVDATCGHPPRLIVGTDKVLEVTKGVRIAGRCMSVSGDCEAAIVSYVKELETSDESGS